MGPAWASSREDGMQHRERYLMGGPEELGDAELIALVLGTGAGGRTARAIAGELLERHGSLSALACAPPGSFAAVRGMGPARAVRLHASLTLGKRMAHESRPRLDPVNGPADAAAWFVPALGELDHEELHALYLDRRRRPLAYRRISAGNDSSTIFDARQVLRPAVELGANAVLVAHNHPSGELVPSTADRDATRRLGEAARVVGVELVDHLLVAGRKWVSIPTLRSVMGGA
jgi:DNA repair protein RadC